MADFFYLLPEYKVAFGDNGGCLYNTKNGKMISIDHEYSKVLKKTLSNKEIDPQNSVIHELINKGMGMIINAPAMQENMIDSSLEGKNKIVYSNGFIQRLFIQITNECNLNCSFCDTSNKVVTKTHCKKWTHETISFSEDEWRDILSQAANLGTIDVRVIGGNPLLKLDELKKVYYSAKENNIHKFSVYSNLEYLNNEILDFLKMEHINLIVQLTQYDDVVRTNIAKCFEGGITCLVQVTMTDDNRKKLPQIMAELGEIGITHIGIDYIYDSSISYDELSTRCFGKVTSQGIEMNQSYNSCLFGQLYINSAGDMTPCPMMNGYVLGNVRKDKLCEVIAQEKYQGIVCLSRSKLRVCRKCSYRYNCMDCRALESSFSGDICGVAFCKEYEKIKMESYNDQA